MMRRITLAVAVPAAIGLASLVGTGTASASANLAHADCVGIAASTTNAAGGHGAGGALVAGWAAASGGVGTYASTDSCPPMGSPSGSPSPGTAS